MKFSRGSINLNSDDIVITYKHKKANGSSFKISRKDYQSYSYFREKSKHELKNWLIVSFHIGLFILYTYIRSLLEASGYSYDSLATLDIIFIPFLTLLIILLMIEILGEFRLIRRFYALIFTRKRNFLRIRIKSGKTYKIPVRNEKEAISIINFIES